MTTVHRSPSASALFRRIADVIEDAALLGAGRWQQDNWGMAVGPDVGECWKAEYNDAPVIPIEGLDALQCDTHACIAGWAVSLGATGDQACWHLGRHASGVYAMLSSIGTAELAQQLLDLEDGEAGVLFDESWLPAGCNDQLAESSPYNQRCAAAALRRLADGATVREVTSFWCDDEGEVHHV